MKFLKNIYRKYYYISPLDLADSAESNRLFNMYWALVWSIFYLFFAVFLLIKNRGNYESCRYQLFFFILSIPDLIISFILSLATKNVARDKAYIYKNIPIYIIYCLSGTGGSLLLFYLQENHYNGLLMFMIASFIMLPLLTVSFAYIVNVFAACIILLPGVYKFWGSLCIFNLIFFIFLLLFSAFYNRFRLKQQLSILKSQKTNLEAKTFGNFTLMYKNKVVKFTRSKSPELLAYLIYKNGSSLNTKELLTVLYGDYADSAKYGASLRLLVSDVKHTLSELEIQNFFVAEYNSFRINPEVVQCDYYDFLAGEPKAVSSFTGEFMSQYSWAEDALDFLEKKAVGAK